MFGVARSVLVHCRYGITRVLEGGNVLEKAAANVSIIRGKLTETRAKAMSARLRSNKQEEVRVGDDYFAAALSLVFHSAHPHIPTLRADIRYFEVKQALRYSSV